MARRSRFAWLCGGSLFSIALLAWGTLSVFDLVAHERSHVHTEIATPVRSVEVHLDNGSLDIVGSDTATPSVDATVSRGLRPTHHSEEVIGDRLVVRSTCASLLDTWCGVDFRLVVPSDVALSISSGDASVTIGNVTGDIGVTSSDGSVHVDGAHGALDLHSSDGNITATKVVSAAVAHASSGDGHVSATFAQSPTDVSVHTGDGGVTIVVPDTPGAYRVETSTGDGGVSTTIRTDPNSANRITVSTGDGSISIRYPAR
jgi:hypothetical protein